jgi:hypothetical protein
MKMRRVLWLVSVAVCFSVGGVSLAQDELNEAEDESAVEEGGDEDGAAEADAGDAIPEQEAGSAEATAASQHRTWWVGAFFEMAVVPSFMLNLILDESPTVANPGFGATITHRDEEGFSWILGLAYTGYGFDGPFRASGDPELDTEYLESDLGLLHVRGQLMWSVDISSKFAFEYGVGVQLGVVLGELFRSEAYKDLGGEYQPCVAALNPDPNFCEPPTNPLLPTNAYDAEGAHYNVKEERVPPIAGTFLLPALALRYTPIDQLQIKLEAAFGLMQFNFGISAAYGLGG